MRKSLTLIAAMALGLVSAKAQSFTESSFLLPGSYNSGGCVGFTDMDGDGYDDLVVLDQSKNLHILYQGSGGAFTDFDLGAVSGSSQWGMCVADFDNDGHKDVFSGGSYDGVHVQNITAPGVSTSMELENGSMFMQACNWADIDNDGYLDAFGCHDDALSRMWQGAADGSLSIAPELMPLTEYALVDYPGNDHSGNYGTVFTDFDNDGDIDLCIAKCRQFVNDPEDPRRINQLWVNDGNGNFTEEADARGLVFYEQSWTVDFADIDNDGDFDCLITNHSTTLFLFENDGAGYFTNVTAGSGLEIEGFFLQAKMEDFDNDGYVDLVFAGGTHGYYRNNGDNTFSEVGGMFPYTDTMHSFAFGDVNRDGQVDLYASYGGGYVTPDNNNDDILWVNDGNDNHWINFDLEGFQSNIDAVGAKVTITGPFGTQVREVRAGESYGITCTATCHFGLGTNDTVDQVVINWPSGLETVIDNPEIDQYHTVNEAPCLVDVEVSASSYGFCPGSDATVSAPEGYESYSWSTGETGTSSITVSESGNYSVLVYDAEGCAGSSNIVSVVEITGEAPAVEVDGDLNICDGTAVSLSASEAESWTWSNGETTQTIEATVSGVYNVTVVDMCDNSSVSMDYTVVVYDAPVGPPSLEDIDFSAGDDVVFTATNGENVQWYDAEFGGNLLGTGDTYTVSAADADITVWASSTHINSGEVVVGGEIDSQTGGAYHNNGIRWLEFDVYEDILLNSVTVFANGAYDRTFEVIDVFGNVVASTTVFVEDGEFVVELGFEIPAGDGYGLRTTTEDPQLWREGTDSTLDYPYAIGDIASITNSTAGPEFSYYYFFYEWVAEPLPVSCESETASVTARVVGVSELDQITPEIFPNPALAGGEIRISNAPTSPFEVEIIDANGRIVAKSTSNIVNLNSVSAGTYVLNVYNQSDRTMLGTTQLMLQ